MDWQQAMRAPMQINNAGSLVSAGMDWQQAAAVAAFTAPCAMDASAAQACPPLFAGFSAPPPPEPREGQMQQQTPPPPPPDPEPAPRAQPSHQEQLRELLQAQQQQLQGIMQLGGGASTAGLGLNFGSSPLSDPMHFLDQALQAGRLQPTPSQQDLLAQMQLQTQMQQQAQQSALQMQLLAMAQAQASQSTAAMQTSAFDFTGMTGSGAPGMEVFANGLPPMPDLPLLDQLVQPGQGDCPCSAIEAGGHSLMPPALEDVAAAAAPASATLDPLQEEILSMLKISMPSAGGHPHQGT